MELLADAGRRLFGRKLSPVEYQALRLVPVRSRGIVLVCGRRALPLKGRIRISERRDIKGEHLIHLGKD